MGLLRVLISGATRGLTLFAFRRAIRAQLGPGERLIAWAGVEESPRGAAAAGVLSLFPLGLTLGRALGLIPEPLTGTMVLTDQRLAVIDAAKLFDHPGARPAWACALARLTIAPNATRLERWFRAQSAPLPDEVEHERAFRFRLRADPVLADDAPAHAAFQRRIASGTDFIVIVRPRTGDGRLVEALVALSASAHGNVGNL